MDFCILGPLEVRKDGDRLALGGPKQRALLAILLLSTGRVVSRDRLIDELWADKPPAAARHALEVQVSRLRKTLGAEGSDGSALLARAPGYVLNVEPGQLDLQRFERLLADGRRALAEGDPAGATRALREAQGLWRGRPLADLEFEPFARVDIERLEELRLVALEEGIEAELALGRHADLIAELEALVAEHPLRERARGQLMLALYRCDRQAEALEVYRDGRRRLVEGLALEPSPTLQRLQQAILTQSTELAPPPTMGTAPDKRALPAPANRTIGRNHELRELRERLRGRSGRLITLTGPGGVGKTRLALEAARAVETDFADGACFVSLAAITTPEDVPATIVKTLGIIVLSGESPERAVQRFLAAKQLLLVADNLEHLLDAAPFIAGLLEACPALSVLATSREPLALGAEERYPVSPLALPEHGAAPDPAALAGVAAVALFTERARARDPRFRLSDGSASAVAEICRRLDGLPLAIELAAARCALLSPIEIAERLDAALGALGTGPRDVHARQQTLRATIDWSHNLLNDAEKQCFACFAVFAGGVTVAAAETITGAGLDTLERLVAKSLLVRRQPAQASTRLAMLETIRAYAAERLAADPDCESVRERHYSYFLVFAQRHGSDRALLSAGGNVHLAALDGEIDNLHEALRWAGGQASAEPALAMCVALCRYWQRRSRYADAVDWIDRALSLPGADKHVALRVRALGYKLWYLRWAERGADEPAVAAQLETIARQSGDPVILSRALATCANRESIAGRFKAADALADEALGWAMTAEDEWEIANAWDAKAMAASTSAELRERVERAALLLTDVGNVHQLGDLLNSATYGALCVGSDHDAKDFIDRAVSIARGLDDPSMWMVIQGNLALAALLTGDTDAASQAFREELRLCRELVVRPAACEGLLGLAAIAAAGGDVRRAARLVGAASAHTYGQHQDIIEARLDAAFLQPGRKRHGAGEWDADLRHGATLNFEDAIAYALEEPLPAPRT
jgi:predicted ATPase/DNA-binding SARP family transcriptional activator